MNTYHIFAATDWSSTDELIDGDYFSRWPGNKTSPSISNCLAPSMAELLIADFKSKIEKQNPLIQTSLHNIFNGDDCIATRSYNSDW